MKKLSALLFIIFFLTLITFIAPVKSFAFYWPFATAFPTLPQRPQTPLPTHQVPSSTPTKTPTPTITKAATAPSVDKTTFFENAINDYRASLGLSKVQTDSNTCNFAATRAKEITTSFTHDGFNNRANSHTLPYPSWHSVTENIAETSNYKEVVTLWINSAEHAANMRKDTPYVCVQGNGNYYAYEGWKP